MKLIDSLFGPKCGRCGQRIKGEKVSTLLCQTCHKLEHERKRKEEERKHREEELEHQRQEQQRREEEQKHKLQEEQKRKEEEQKRKAKKEARKRRQGKPSFEEIQSLRAEKEKAKQLAEARHQKNKEAEYEMQRAQARLAEERFRKRMEEEEADKKKHSMSIRRGGLGEPYCSGRCYDAAGKDISAAALLGYDGPCGFCQRPVLLSLGSGNSAHPFRKIFLYICPECRSKAEAHAAGIRECCFCGGRLA
jgi:hypothetical protein